MKKNRFVFVQSRKTRVVLLSLMGISILGVVACKARKFNSNTSEAEIINRPTDFNDSLPEGFDLWTWEKKTEYLWNQNLNSPLHVMEDPSPKSESPILGSPEQFLNIRKAVAFVRDTLDFRGRSLESIAGLTVYTRLRDVYPKDVVDEKGRRSKHKRATHPTGTLGVVRFVPANNTPYTGMFKTGATGLARLSSATNPFITDMLNRSVAIKFPVTASYSRSLFAMNRVIGQKLGPGQDLKASLRGDPKLRETMDYRYFKEGKHLTNILPPPQGFEANISAKFADVVKYILTTTGRLKAGEEDKWDFLDLASRLSVDNMAWHNQDGTEAAPRAGGPSAPLRVTLLPNPALYAAGPITEKVDFRKELAKIEPGTTLWTVYGLDSKANPEVNIDDPKPLDISRIGQVIGTIVLEKPFYASVFANEEIMFKHFVADLQSKEDLDRAFAVVGEDTLEKPEESVLDTRPANFLTEVPTARLNCDASVKTKFDDNPRKKRVFGPYLSEFDFMTSDVAPFCMAMKNPSPGFPEQFQGVWWMNGNTVAETLVAFGQADWDNNTKRLKLDPTSPYSWGWYASVATRDRPSSRISSRTTPELEGMKGFKAIQNRSLRFTFNPAETKNVIQIDSFAGMVPMPKLISDLVFLERREDNDTLELMGVEATEDESTPGQDVLIRRTRILGGLIAGDYRFTRILDGEGKPLPANYKAYLDAMKRFNLVYTAIRNDTPAPEKKRLFSKK